MLNTATKQSATLTKFMDKTWAYICITLPKHECLSRYGVTKPGVKRALDNGIIVYFGEHDAVYYKVTFSLHINPLIATKNMLIELGAYKRRKEGISPHCGACTVEFGEDCRDCPNYQARLVADNFIDVNCLRANDIRHLWLMQINHLYTKVKVLEAYIARSFGIEALKATTTRLNIELNSNIYVKCALTAMEARQGAFSYIFDITQQVNNPDNPFPILIGKDITDSKHRAKYYVKAIGRGDAGSIIRREMMLRNIPLIRGTVGEMSDQIISLYEKYLAKYEWVENAAQCKLNSEDEVLELTSKVLHRNRLNLVEIQGVVPTLADLIKQPQMLTRSDKVAYMALIKLMKLGIGVKVMRGYVCIASKYFNNKIKTEVVK